MIRKLLATCFGVLVPMLLPGAESKIASELTRATAGSTVAVIVQYRNEPTARQHQRIIARGGVMTRSFRWPHSAAYSIPTSAIGSLAADPEVVHVSPDRKLHGMLDLTAAAVGAASAWTSGWTGKGIGVAVIDSGISDHPDLDSRVVYKQDFVGGGTDDHYGHGEHVAGIIGGSGKSSVCKDCTRLFRGIAPQVNLVNLRVLDQNGDGTDSGVIAAIQQAITLKTKYNIRVINLSVGRPVFESYKVDPLCQAVEAAWKAGIAVVVAAGNGGRDDSQGTDGYGTITAPGNDPYVITVGAMKTMGTPDRSDDVIASYSSKGPTMFDHIVKPDVVAPGNRVDSLLAPTSHFVQTYSQNVVPVSYYQGTNKTQSSNKYFTLSGTSMATPVVSGAIAVLLQAQPSLTPDQVKAKMMLTAYKTLPPSSSTTDPATGITYTSQSDMFTVGAGYLDIDALLDDTSTPAGTALSPVAVYDAASGNVYLATDPSVVWNSQAVWGNRAVWKTAGPDAMRAVWGTWELDGMRAVWGTFAVWGSSTDTGFQTIWGARAVWGTSDTAAEMTIIAIRGEN